MVSKHIVHTQQASAVHQSHASAHTSLLPAAHHSLAWLCSQAVLEALEQDAGSADQSFSSPRQRHSLQMASALRRWLHPAHQLVSLRHQPSCTPAGQSYIGLCRDAKAGHLMASNQLSKGILSFCDLQLGLIATGYPFWMTQRLSLR